MGLARDIIKLIRRGIRAAISDVHTHMVCQVVSYTAATNTCSLQPCIKVIRTDDPNNLTAVQLPVIEDIPVKQIGSGKCLLTVAPQAGSYGELHVSERSLDNWLTKGGIVDPASSRKFDLSDGVFHPGLYPFAVDGDNGLLVVPVATDRISLRNRLNTGQISVLDDGTVQITGGVDGLALSSKVDALWLTLYTLLTTWVPAPPDGGAAFKAAAILAFPPPGPLPTGSAKVKVDS
jgi:hypothetical protein